MKAGTTDIQHLVQTLKALKRLRTRVAPEQALHPDNATIDTVQSLNKWSYIYALNGASVISNNKEYNGHDTVCLGSTYYICFLDFFVCSFDWPG